MLEYRKEPRFPMQFLIMSSVQDHHQEEWVSVENVSLHGVRVATARAWEPGSHVAVRSINGDLTNRARVVYCQRVSDKEFAVGLFLTPADDANLQDSPLVTDERT